MAVAGYLGIQTAGRSTNEVALEVGETALAQFGQPFGEIVYTRRATPKRQALWHKLGLTPRAIDREVTEVMHRTHEGVDLDAENILKSALRCSLADGWGGAMLSTDISDILFGTPVAADQRGQPRRAQGRPGQRRRPRPRADAVGDDGRGGRATPS